MVDCYRSREYSVRLSKVMAEKVENGTDADCRAELCADARAVPCAVVRADFCADRYAEPCAETVSAPAGRPVYRGECFSLSFSSIGATCSSCLQVAPLELQEAVVGGPL